MRFCEKFITNKKLGKGSFGEVYEGIDLDTAKDVAIKKEIKRDNSRVFHEARIYKLFKNKYFPRVKWVGTDDDYNILVIDKLGKSLDDIFKSMNYTFSLKCVLLIAIQLLHRVKYIHLKNIIHRDLKPNNCLIGLNNNNDKIYIIDYGLSKSYINHDTNKHIELQHNRSLVGTVRYTSVNIHNGLTPSRRDDLQSIGYMLVYFMTGKLPWQNIKVDDKKEKYRLIKECKKTYTPTLLCKNIQDDVFRIYLEYVELLDFADTPNYDYLIKLFKKTYKARGFVDDNMMDWC